MSAKIQFNKLDPGVKLSKNAKFQIVNWLNKSEI